MTIELCLGVNVFANDGGLCAIVAQRSGGVPEATWRLGT